MQMEQFVTHGERRYARPCATVSQVIARVTTVTTVTTVTNVYAW
jgi:hypothetical protein